MGNNLFPAGALVISLDFELNWGVRDARKNYEANLLGAREVIPPLLELFQLYGIHATWATVGLLFCRTRDEMLEPAVRPQYANEKLCSYRAIPQVGADERSDPLHFGSSLIEKIRSYPNQEIASHTFSHYYCLEPGQDLASFEADLQASIAVARKHNLETTSLVFPRNQVNEQYLDCVARLGFRSYRGNPRRWIHQPGRSLLRRGLRFADSYVPLSGDSSYALERTKATVNVAASRFLRPYPKSLAALEGWRSRRICRELTTASRRGHVYHLWWHPHNFGLDQGENLSFLESVLRHFDALREKQGMESLTMAECATRATKDTGDVAVLSFHA